MAKKKKKKQISIKRKLIMTLGVIFALAPIIAYAVIISVFDAQSPGFMILGLIGSIVIMLPIFGLAMLIADISEHKKMYPDDKRALKRVVAMLVPCLLLICISLSLPFISKLYSKINEAALTFYAFGILVLMLMTIFYAISHGAIDMGFRHDGLSLSTIKKLKKGTRNYWWYEALNKEYEMGILYYCNKFFTLSFVSGSVIHLVLGWWLPFAWVSTALFWVEGLTISVLVSYDSFVTYKNVSKKQHQIEYGKMRTAARKNSAISSVVALPFLIITSCCIITYFALRM